MAAISEAAFPPAEAWSAEALAGHLSVPGAIGLVCDAAMAIGRAVAEEAELYTLAVLPDRRRGGLGRAVLRAFVLQAGLLRADTVFLEVSPANAAALALYRAEGFAEIGRRAGYYPDGGDALVMRRKNWPGGGEIPTV